jgi:hypothetical protein
MGAYGCVDERACPLNPRVVQGCVPLDRGAHLYLHTSTSWRPCGSRTQWPVRSAPTSPSDKQTTDKIAFYHSLSRVCGLCGAVFRSGLCCLCRVRAFFVSEFAFPVRSFPSFLFPFFFSSPYITLPFFFCLACVYWLATDVNKYHKY